MAFAARDAPVVDHVLGQRSVGICKVEAASPSGPLARGVGQGQLGVAKGIGQIDRVSSTDGGGVSRDLHVHLVSPSLGEVVRVGLFEQPPPRGLKRAITKSRRELLVPESQRLVILEPSPTMKGFRKSRSPCRTVLT